MLGALTVTGPLMAGGSKPEILLSVIMQNNETAEMSKTVPLELNDPPELVHFSVLPIVTQNYLWDATLLENGAVMVQFDPGGTTALEAATRLNMGKIIAVLFNGRILLSAVVDRPITNGRLLLRGITPEEFQKLQAFIKKRRAD